MLLKYMYKFQVVRFSYPAFQIPLQIFCTIQVLDSIFLIPKSNSRLSYMSMLLLFFHRFFEIFLMHLNRIPMLLFFSLIDIFQQYILMLLLPFFHFLIFHIILWKFYMHREHFQVPLIFDILIPFQYLYMLFYPYL